MEGNASVTYSAGASCTHNEPVVYADEIRKIVGRSAAVPFLVVSCKKKKMELGKPVNIVGAFFLVK